MKKPSTLMVGCLVGLLALVAGVNAYRSHQAMSQEMQENKDQLQSLKTEVDRINTQLTNFNTKLSKISQRPMDALTSMDWPDSFSNAPRGQGPPQGRRQGPGFGNGPRAGIASPSSTGDPAQSEKVAAYRNQLLERNAALHQADRDTYGDRVSELYQAARFNPSTRGNTEAKETAFQQLITEYPQSNEAAMVMSEKALQAAKRADTATAEKYYQTLSQNENFSSLVTDSGIEPQATLQAYLANQYVQQNRFEEANAMLQALESNHAEGYVSAPGRQGGIQWKPVTQTVTKLRTKMTNSAAVQ